MTTTDTTRAVTRIEIPPGARIPIGNPARWIAAAIAANWQCQCVTAVKGTAKNECGRSHFDDQDHRCRVLAAGPCAMRLVLAPDAHGVLRLLCEDCAKGHARTAARIKALIPDSNPADLGQESLFDLPAN